MLRPEQFFGRHLPMTQEDILAASKKIGIAPGTIAAVIQVEAGGDPFLSDGRPKILYEAHKFGSFTKNKYPRHMDTKGKALSSTKWNRNLYGPAGAWQYKRLEMAMNLDNQAAMRATSWGGFQILADNWRMCGFNSVDDFVIAAANSAGEQLMAFCGFIQSAGLVDELKRKDWDDFARGYNGPAFRENKYDTKLAQADAKLVNSWAKMFMKANDPMDADQPAIIDATAEIPVDMSDGSAEYQLTKAEVAGLQAALNASRLLVRPIKADGWYGNNTAAAIKVLQKANKLEQSGLFDPDTLKLLHYEPPAKAA